MFTIRSRKAYKSLIKHTAKYGYVIPFTELEFSLFLVDSLKSGICPYCRGSLTWDNFSPDHVTPFLKDGSPFLDNITIVCATCNFTKGPYVDGRQVNVQLSTI